MFKWLKEWAKDYNEAQKALHESGIFHTFSPWGGYYTHIVNKEYDRSNTIRKYDTNSKVDRQI